jgi:predicted transcriptional regulator of viral defense system
MDNFLTIIYGSKQTVFTSREIAILIKEENANKLKSKLAYYVKTGKLIRLRRGVFSKNSAYDKNELAVRIFTPSYISFETVLAKEGVIFQYYEAVFVASYLSRNLKFKDNKLIFRKLKNEILFNQKGIINRGTYFQASKERAFLDMLYLFGDYYFDNLRSIDWNICFDMVDIYGSKTMKKRLKNYYKKYAK